MKAGRALLPLVAAALGGCALNFIEPATEADAARVSADATVIHGRINYFVDGQSKAPYGSFRPAWPAPRFSALRLESGEPFASPLVADGDGSFRWKLRPGSYVISRIGAGQIHDDTYIAWPRIAFLVPPSSPPVYLGHLVLDGKTRSGTTTLSTGRVIQESGVSYQFVVRDEGPAGPRALMFHDPRMPIGDALVEDWRKSRRQLIERIFGAAAPRIPE
ncbi:MAG TPA: hypothetical protein VF876_08545 [Burkholderiales bacterium]